MNCFILLIIHRCQVAMKVCPSRERFLSLLNPDNIEDSLLLAQMEIYTADLTKAIHVLNKFYSDNQLDQ